jgi:hypothetical protein
MQNFNITIPPKKILRCHLRNVIYKQIYCYGKITRKTVIVLPHRCWLKFRHYGHKLSQDIWPDVNQSTLLWPGGYVIASIHVHRTSNIISLESPEAQYEFRSAWRGQFSPQFLCIFWRLSRKELPYYFNSYNRCKMIIAARWRPLSRQKVKSTAFQH